MSKHTPGPWQMASEDYAWDEIVGNVDGEYEDERGLVCTYTRICEIQDDAPVPEQQANARLICAAPDLLNALSALADAAEARGIPCDAARAAIRKAGAA
jgi:hypothetical protein